MISPSDPVTEIILLRLMKQQAGERLADLGLNQKL